MSVLDLIIPVEWSSENESMKQLRRNKVILMLKHSKADCLFVLESLSLAKLLAHEIKQGVSHFLFFFSAVCLESKTARERKNVPEQKFTLLGGVLFNLYAEQDRDSIAEKTRRKMLE